MLLTFTETWKVLAMEELRIDEDRYCGIHRYLSISIHADTKISDRLLRTGSHGSAGRGRGSRTRDPVPRPGRPRPPPTAQLPRGTAGRRSLRLQPHRTSRAQPAHGEPSPEGTHRGRSARARTARHVDLLPAPPGTTPTALRHPRSAEAPDDRDGAARRAVTAEAVGTALLLAAIVGSGIMGERIAAGNVAIALLANSVATGAALGSLVRTLGPLSGAPFSPLVTLSVADQGGLPRRNAPTYVAAQVVGAALGVVCAHLNEFPLPHTPVHQMSARNKQAVFDIV